MQSITTNQKIRFRCALRNLCLLGLILTVLSANRALAQMDQGAITGIVLDPTGAVIPDAQVTLTNTDTGLVLKSKANASGVYFFSPIKTGHYSVSATATGFGIEVQENITVHVTDRLNIPLTLKPGHVTETVTVSTAPLLQAETGETAIDLDSKFINNSPLANRNWIFLAHESAGVTPFVGRGSGNGDFVVNGQHEEQNNFMLDGVDNNVVVSDYINGSSYNLAPPPDAIAEFKLETSNFSAEIGRGHGAVLNATTKSGTNQIHGDVWEYVRNTALDALPWNFNTTFQNPAFHLNQFGATLGFPIIKNKLFYFGDIQESRYSVASNPTTMTVPTPRMRQGDFTELLNPALTSNACPVVLFKPNSNTGSYNCSGGVPTKLTGNLQQSGTSLTTVNGYTFAPGQNVFNPTTLDPVALNILKQYPLPNANGWTASNNSNPSSSGTTTNNYVVALKTQSDPIQWDQRLDWNISNRDQAYFRYDYQHQINILDAPLGPILDGFGSNAGHNQNYLSENAMLSETHTFSPSLINEFRFAFNWGKFSNLQYNATVNEADALGMHNMPFSEGPNNGGLPPVSIGGIQAFGSHANDPALEGENVYEILDNVTTTVGNHSLKVGFEDMPIRMFSTATGQSRGTYSFGGQFTGVTGVTNTGNGVADFLAQGYDQKGNLLGTDNMSGGGIGNYALNNYEFGYIAAYLQDNWRVTHKLTLDLGLRYEYFTPKKEMAGEWANWVRETGYVDSNGGHGTSLFEMPASQRSTPLAPGLAQLMAADNVQIVYSDNPRLSTFPKANWSPRLGLAYMINNKTVVRLGAGIFFGAFEPGGGSALTQNPPYVITTNLTLGSCSAGTYCPSLYAQGDTLENGLQSFIQNGIANYASFPNIMEQDPVMHTPYTMNYNVSVQRALSNTLSATVSYVGNLGRHLVTLTNGPAMPMALTIAGVNNKSLQPAPHFNSAQWMTWEGASAYDSLQVTLQKRYGNGLSFLGTYTWAHALTDAVDLLGGDIGGYRMASLFPISGEWTNSGYDIRHRLVANAQYELPFGRGKRFANRAGLLDYVVGGWKSSFIYSIQTGQPFTVGISNQTNAQGGYNNHPIMIADPFSTNLTPPGSTATTNSPGQTSCPTQVRTKLHWYNQCAFTNPLGSAQVAAHATGHYSYYSPAISGDPAINVGIYNADGTINPKGAPVPYIDTAAAAAPFFGGVPNTLHGPGNWRFNMSLFKDFRAWREQYLEFRVDAFNVLNHPTWGNSFASTGDNAGNAGQITGPASTQSNTIDARYFQLSVKYVF